MFGLFWKFSYVLTAAHCEMMFGKLQKNFWYDHSNACQKCPKVLLHNAPMWNGAKQKIQFFQFFQKQNRILLFEYFTYMKNLIFWATSSWCSSKIEFLERGSKAAIVAYERPSHSIKFWATSTWYTSKYHIILAPIRFKLRKLVILLKKLKKMNFLFRSISHSCVM